MIEKIGGAHGHELYEVVFVFGRQLLEALSEESKFFEITRIERGGIRRNHAQNRFHEAAHRDHRLAEFFVGFGVELRVALDFAAGFGVIIDAPEVIAVGHGRESAVERKNFQAVAREIEVANNFRAKKRDDVRKNGKFEAGNDFFGDSGAAENVAAFENKDFLPRFREVSRIDEAVVAATDDNNVVALRHEDWCESPAGKTNAERVEAFYRCG